MGSSASFGGLLAGKPGRICLLSGQSSAEPRRRLGRGSPGTPPTAWDTMEGIPPIEAFPGPEMVLDRDNLKT